MLNLIKCYIDAKFTYFNQSKSRTNLVTFEKYMMFERGNFV